MDLVWLKAERASQRSYLGYLGLDLLGFLWDYLKGSLTHFQGRVVSQEKITHQKTGFWYAAQNQNYFVIPFPHRLEFYAQDGELIHRFVSVATEDLDAQLEGHLARFCADQQIYILDLSTNQLSAQPGPPHLADIENISYVLVRKHDVIVNYQVGANWFLSRMDMLGSDILWEKDINPVIVQVNERYLIIRTDEGILYYHFVTKQWRPLTCVPLRQTIFWLHEDQLAYFSRDRLIVLDLVRDIQLREIVLEIPIYSRSFLFVHQGCLRMISTCDETLITYQ